MTRTIPGKLNLFLFLITLFLNLMIRITPPMWTNFSDPYDYLHQSKIPLNEKDFYFPEKASNFYPRPFTVPLFYKIAGSDPETIIQLQKFMHSLAAFFLCYVVLLFLRKIGAAVVLPFLLVPIDVVVEYCGLDTYASFGIPKCILPLFLVGLFSAFL